MLIRMKKNVGREAVRAVVNRVAQEDFDVLVNREQDPMIIAVLGGDTENLDESALRRLPGVEDVLLTKIPLCLSVDELSSIIDEYVEGWELP